MYSDLKELYLGRIVISCLGTPGVISGLSVGGRYPTIDFLWVNGKVTMEAFIQWFIDPKEPSEIQLTNKSVNYGYIELISDTYSRNINRKRPHDKWIIFPELIDEIMKKLSEDDLECKSISSI